MRSGEMMGGDPWWNQVEEPLGWCPAPPPGELGDPARARQFSGSENPRVQQLAHKEEEDSSTQALVLQNEEHRAEGDS